jgi:vacuolar protein sorting-associated protein 13A/C
MFDCSILQMALYLAEASRYFACTDLFREPSKYAWSDYYEDHFIVPNQRIALVTNKRVILLQVKDFHFSDSRSALLSM